MQIKKDTKVKVQYRPELGTGTVLHVAESPGSYTRIDIVFEKTAKDFWKPFHKTFLCLWLISCGVIKTINPTEIDQATRLIKKFIMAESPL